MNGYLEEVLEPSLLFGLFASLLGIAMAYSYNRVFLAYAALALLGVVAAQISANVLDDYVDYRNGIDAIAIKRGMSGGSRVIIEKRAKPEYVLIMGLSFFFAALLIGAYLTFVYPPILPFLIIGATSIALYAKYLVKVPFLSEFSIGVSFFSISVGTFLVSGLSYSHLVGAGIASILPGMMVGLAGFVNSIPDKKADKIGGRRTCATFMGRCAGSYYYLTTLAIGYIALFAGIRLGYVPDTTAMVLVIIPELLYVFFGIKGYKSSKRFEPRMKLHFLMFISMTALLILSYVVV